MRIIASFVIFIALSFLLTGCGNKSNTQNNEEAKNNVEFTRTSTENNIIAHP